MTLGQIEIALEFQSVMLAVGNAFCKYHVTG
jgi:hypothetical protein